MKCFVWPQTADLFNHYVSCTSIATYWIHSAYLPTSLQRKRSDMYISMCKYILKKCTNIFMSICMYTYLHCLMWYYISLFIKEITRSEFLASMHWEHWNFKYKKFYVNKHFFSAVAVNSCMELMLHKEQGWLIWLSTIRSYKCVPQLLQS